MAEWWDVEDTTSGARQLEGQRYPPISDALFALLVPILKAGNVAPSREAAEQLGFIAQSCLQDVLHRDRRPRQRATVREARRRLGDPPRERLIRRRGAPANRAMRQLFGALESFWLDHAQSAPGVSYCTLQCEYTGPFVRFAMGICKELEIAMSGLEISAPSRSPNRHFWPT